MKKREEGFLGADKIDHNGEIFDYIRELHEYLWKFIRILYPSQSGDLRDILDGALNMTKMKCDVPSIFRCLKCGKLFSEDDVDYIKFFSHYDNKLVKRKVSPCCQADCCLIHAEEEQQQKK